MSKSLAQSHQSRSGGTATKKWIQVANGSADLIASVKEGQMTYYPGQIITGYVILTRRKDSEDDWTLVVDPADDVVRGFYSKAEAQTFINRKMPVGYEARIEEHQVKVTIPPPRPGTIS